MIIPLDINKAIKINNRGLLTTKELKQIEISISALGLVITRVIYKLSISNREVTNRDNDFEGQAYEIENATS